MVAIGNGVIVEYTFAIFPNLLIEHVGRWRWSRISRASSAHEFDLSFLYDKLDTVFGKH
jgi:hypothetical protein